MGLADRQREKAEKIRIRLGGSGALADPFPWKPKYMHWQTYFRLREKAESAELTSLQLFLGSLERLEVALNRRG